MNSTPKKKGKHGRMDTHCQFSGGSFKKGKNGALYFFNGSPSNPGIEHTSYYTALAVLFLPFLLWKSKRYLLTMVIVMRTDIVRGRLAARWESEKPSQDQRYIKDATKWIGHVRKRCEEIVKVRCVKAQVIAFKLCLFIRKAVNQSSWIRCF